MSFVLFLQGWDPAMHGTWTGAGVAAINAWTLAQASATYFTSAHQWAYRNAYYRANAANRATLENAVLAQINAANAAAAAAAAAAPPALQLTPASLTPVNINMTPVMRNAYAAAMDALAITNRNAALLRFPVEATQGAAGGLVNFSDFNTYCLHAIGGATARNPASCEDVHGFCTGLDAHAAHFRGDWGNNFNHHNRNKRTANAMQQDINAIHAEVANQRHNNAIAMETALIGNLRQYWDRVKGQSALYWQREVPAYRARYAYLGLLRAARNTRNPSPSVRIYRHVSRGEANDVINHVVVRQGPNPLETEKWFTTDPDQVGNGVVHGDLLEIELRPGAFSALTGASGRDAAATINAFSGLNPPGRQWVTLRGAHNWNHHLVFLKQNEAPSFGIHEDGLGVFNEFISRVLVKRPRNQEIPTVVNFNHFAQCNYPNIP